MKNNDKSGLLNESIGAIIATMKALEDCGMTASGLARLRSDKGLAKMVAEMVEREVGVNQGMSQAITVDYTKTIEEFLSEMDCVWKHKYVCDKQFPILEILKGEKIRKKARLFRFDDESFDIGSDYRFATIFELIAYYRQVEYSHVFHIVGAGSKTSEWVGGLIPVIDTIEGKISLDLRHEADVHVVGNYFLAIQV
ncbi:MAG: hypothetical protein ACM3PZ_01110 [Bacillota bacterium]